MKLIDIKDTLPVGFIPIQETVDTQEVAFRKKRLCIKFIPRDSTEAAICDIRILGRSKQAPPQYTFIGELNNMGIWYRMGRVPRNHESSQPTTPSPQVPSSTPAPNLPRHLARWSLTAALTCTSEDDLLCRGTQLCPRARLHAALVSFLSKFCDSFLALMAAWRNALAVSHPRRLLLKNCFCRLESPVRL
uniref:Multivesicular body subunit 12B n=1 Tax=Dromaius novaehollandiae TaxID=8790 RepID=A0A8C4K6X4_DRONO